MNSIANNRRTEIQFHIDQPLMFACLSLLSIGFIMVTSASLHLGVKMANDISHYPISQLIHIFLGLLLAVGVCQIPMKTWENYGQILFIIGVVLLMVVLLPGVGSKVNGSVRWISLFGIRVQVSELIKLISIIYVAGYVNRHADHVKSSPYGLLKPLLLFSVASILLLIEPDFGSAVVIMVIAMGIMFLGGARISQFIILLAVISCIAVLLVYISPYRLMRVLSFTDPWADPKKTGFQLIQALISFGRGELFGVGLGNGIQKLFYLPEAHTDFLFSVLGEELGLTGVILVISLFSTLIVRAFTIAVKAEKNQSRFSALVAYGLGIWFGFQSFVNMGVNMGMLPTKGLTLPLMSYGGGSMIVMCCSVAILFRINHEESIEKLRTVHKDKFL